MRLVLFALVALGGSFSVFAENPMDICEQAPELATLFLDYKTQADTPAKRLSGAAIFIRSQKPATSACVALAIDETGVPQDASVFLPPGISLSKRERKTLLAHRFSPALSGGKPVKSIDWIMVVKSKCYVR